MTLNCSTTTRVSCGTIDEATIYLKRGQVARDMMKSFRGESLTIRLSYFQFVVLLVLHKSF